MIQERTADSDYTNQDLYYVLLDHARWLIKREIRSGNIYNNNSLFQTLGCQEVIETSTVEKCCPVKVNCKIYRTKDKLPETWIDENGPVLRSVTSVDGTTDFFVTSPITWQSKRADPYHNPHFVNIVGYFTEDISEYQNCRDEKECERFLDSDFPLPDWLQAEMMAKAIQSLLPSKQMIEDEEINKNTNRKN